MSKKPVPEQTPQAAAAVPVKGTASPVKATADSSAALAPPQPADSNKKPDSMRKQAGLSAPPPNGAIALIPERTGQKKTNIDNRARLAQKIKTPLTAKAAAAAVPSPKSVTPPEAATGILKVAINPPSAEVTLDGVKLFAREMSEGKQLKTGAHQLAATAQGYDVYSRTVNVEKGAVQIVSADLVLQTKGLAAVHINSYPWARIYIDGAFQGNSPTAKPIAVSEGPHKITLKQNGYKTYEETVTIGKGELRRIKVQLVGE
jgi:hypothetical protein